MVVITIKYPDYVHTPSKCLVKNLKGGLASRKCLTVTLKNAHKKSLLFILMNPSQADEINSDKTINKCASIAYHDFSQFHVGKFSIVNVYPFYQSKSSLLQDTITNIKQISQTFYYKELFENLRIIRNKIVSSDYIILGTGGIPPTIRNKKEYQFILDSIMDTIETQKQTVFLTTSKKKYNAKYIYANSYSYHICPQGNPNTIDALKRHKVVNGVFTTIPDESEIVLTP